MFKAIVGTVAVVFTAVFMSIYAIEGNLAGTICFGFLYIGNILIWSD